MVIRCLGDDLAGFVHDEFHGPPPINAPVSAAAMARNLSNLVPAPAFQPMKITASVFDMRHIAHRPLCTDPHETKAENARLQIYLNVAVARSPHKLTLSEGP
jgi:hypothetical protein